MTAHSQSSFVRFLIGVDTFAGKLSSSLVPVAKIAALALLVTTIFDLVSRRFFVLGSTRLQEFEWHMHVVIFALCLGYAYVKDRHVRIDLFHCNFKNKTKNIIEIFGILFLTIPYVSLIMYFGYQFFWQSFVIDEASKAALGVPHRWMIKFFLPLGFTLLLIVAVGLFCRSLAELLEPDSTNTAEESLQ